MPKHNIKIKQETILGTIAAQVVDDSGKIITSTVQASAKILKKVTDTTSHSFLLGKELIQREIFHTISLCSLEEFITAAAKGDIETLSRLDYTDEHLNYQDKNGNTPLHFAVVSNALPVVRLLLREGAKLSLVNNAQQSALSFAIQAGRVEAVQLLLAQGATFTAEDIQLAQHLSYKEKRMPILALLVPHDDYQNTTLHLAVQAGDKMLVEKIYQEYPYLVNFKNQLGHTPWSYLLAHDETVALSIAKVLFSQQHYTYIDKSFMGMLSAVADAKKDRLLRFLLAHFPIIDHPYVNGIIYKALAKYLAEKDLMLREKVLDAFVDDLIVQDFKRMFKENSSKYSGLLRSWNGWYQEEKEGPKISFEGFSPLELLPMRFRTLLKIIIQLQLNQEVSTFPQPYAQNFQSLKEELRIALSSYYHHCIQVLVFPVKKIRDISLLLQNEAFDTYLNNIIGNLQALNENESYCIVTGFQNHTIYGNFIRHQDYPKQFLLQFSNLGDGCTKYHQKIELFSQKGNRFKYYPAVFLMSADLKDPSNRAALKNYLTKLIRAADSKKSIGIDYIYNVTQYAPHLILGSLSKEALAELVDVKRDQTAGNCVVKNYNASMQWRIGSHTELARSERNRLYRWFRAEELRLLPSKYYSDHELVEASRIKSAASTKLATRLVSDEATHQQPSGLEIKEKTKTSGIQPSTKKIEAIPAKAASQSETVTSYANSENIRKLQSRLFTGKETGFEVKRQFVTVHAAQKGGQRP